MRESKSVEAKVERTPSPAAGLLFLIAGLASLFGLIGALDPLL